MESYQTIPGTYPQSVELSGDTSWYSIRDFSLSGTEGKRVLRQLDSSTRSYYTASINSISSALEPMFPMVDLPYDAASGENIWKVHHLRYIILHVMDLETFRGYGGWDLTSFGSEASHERTKYFMVDKRTPWVEVYRFFGSYYQTDPSDLRLWWMCRRVNQTIRPQSLIPCTSQGQFCQLLI
jgi:hypothetical protein